MKGLASLLRPRVPGKRFYYAGDSCAPRDYVFGRIHPAHSREHDTLRMPGGSFFFSHLGTNVQEFL